MDYIEPLMISFSGGRSSAYMTERLLKETNPDTTIICFANTGKECEATLQFVDNCNQLWGGIIQWLEYCPDNHFKIVTYKTASRNGEPFEALIKKRKYVPNVVTRFCTQELKIRVIKKFMQSLGFKEWTNAIGIRYDEPKRWRKINGSIKRDRWETYMPMVEWRTVKADVIDYWIKMPFDLQLLPHEGNCDMCFLKGKNKLKQIIRDNPEKIQWWIEQEKLTGATFHKEYSYAALAELVTRQPEFDFKDEDIDCFCNID